MERHNTNSYWKVSNILFKQFESIFINNLKINIRKKLFLKEAFVLLFIYLIGLINLILLNKYDSGINMKG